MNEGELLMEETTEQNTEQKQTEQHTEQKLKNRPTGKIRCYDCKTLMEYSDNKIHRYFPDFLVKKKTPDGKIETIVVEIKPESQSKPPKPMDGKPTKSYLREVYNWGTNSAKWKAANKYCMDRGWQFAVLGETALGIKF